MDKQKTVTKKKCMLCDSQLGLVARVVRGRFCSGKCRSEYHKLMTNLALARLNTAPIAEKPELADRNREMNALVRMMQVDMDEQTRLLQV